MDETAVDIIARETALANFDHARDDFLDAVGSVPDNALDYKSEGDERSVGDLVPHMAGMINMYIMVLDMLHRAEFGEVRMAAMPGLPTQAQVEGDVGEAGQMAVPVEAGSRMRDLTELESLHDTLAGKLRELAHEEHGHQAPVFYPEADEAYLTSASDILKWMTDQYREHTLQVGEILATWKRST